MKKKLLTIFSVLAVIVAMMLSVIACTKNPTPTPGPGPDEGGDEKVDLSELAKEGLGVLQTGLTNVMNNALDETDEKSYDLTIFVKAKVGDSVDADVKLHIAGTFADKKNANSGLVDVIVGGESYLTLYTEKNVVYVGEALTQDGMNWFKVDAAEAGGLVDKFFPKLLEFFPFEVGSEGKEEPIQDVIGGFLPLIKTVGTIIMATDVEGGIVKNELADGRVQYVNTLALSKLGSALENLKTFFDIRTLLATPAVEPYMGLINTVSGIIFGGDLDALLDGKIKAEDAPTIQLNFAAKNKNLTDFEITYANDFAFDSAADAEKTPVSVAFGFENVNITTSSSTKITTAAVEKGVKDAVEPAIKLTIGAELPQKDVKATVNAYVVPKIAITSHEHYSVPTTEYYTREYYWVEGEAAKKEMEADHKCSEDKTCIHLDGYRRLVTEGHECPEGKVCRHDFDYETGEVKEGHVCANKDCNHYDVVDTYNFKDFKAYAVAVKDNGDEYQLACDVELANPELKFDVANSIVLKIDLTGMWDLLGVDEADRSDLPTTYYKELKLWEAKDPEPEEEVPETDDDIEMPEFPKKDEAAPSTPSDTKLPDNLIDKVFATFAGGFNIGKVMDLVSPVIDFAKDVYNTALKDNMEGDEDTNTATLDVAAILKALVNNKTITGSDKLNINKEGNVTKYLKDLAGIAGLVDNIMRYTDPEKKELKVGEAYTEADLKALVKKYAGIDITDKAFEDTTLELTGIRGKGTNDDGLGFIAELKSEGVTVLKLTMKVDIIDAKKVPEQKVIGTDFTGEELEKVKVQDTDENGEPKVDENDDPVMVEVDGQGLNDINALMKAILEAFEAKQKATAEE